MQAGTNVTFAVKALDDLAACFDATCAEVFATSCHLVAGERDRAEELMIDVYLSLHRAVAGGATVIVDHEWIVATALRQVLGHQPDGENDALTALERAALELHLVDGCDIDSVAATLGLTSADVIRSLARYDDHSQFSTDLVADLLQRSELWLDDSTRRRARAALRRGQRPTRRLTAPDEPQQRVPVTESPRPVPPALTAADDKLAPPRRTVIAAVCAAMALITVGIFWILPGDETSTTAPISAVGSTPTDERSPAATDVPARDRPTSVASAAESSPAVSAISDPGNSAPGSSASATSGTSTSGTSTSGTSVGSAGASAGAGSSPTRPARSPGAAAGFVLAEPPPGFGANGASEEIQARTAGRFELWAEPEATRTTGRWLALATKTYATSRTTIVPGASREMIGGSPAVLVTAPDGVSTFTVQPVSGGQFSLTGGGYSNDELSQLAAGITVRRGEPTFDSALDSLRDGLELLAEAPSRFGDLAAQVTEGPRRWTTYLSDDRLQYITVTTRATTPNDLLMSEFLLPASTDVLAPVAPQRNRELGDRVLSVSGAPIRTDSARSEPSISWHEGDETVTISGNTELYVLLGAIPSVRRATSDEWSALFEIEAADLPRAETQPLRGTMVRIGRTTFADRSRWTISMTNEKPVGVRFEVRNDSAAGIQGEAVFATDPPAAVHEYVSMSSTLLVVSIDDPGDATGVRISLAGSNPVTIPLVPVDVVGLHAAGYAFSDVAPYTVELVDATGATVRSIGP